MSSVKRRIFLSYPNPETSDHRRLKIQQQVVRRITELDLHPEIFFFAGMATSIAWSIPNAIEVMRRCVGAVVIAFPRWEIPHLEEAPLRLASDYAQIEGAIATTLRLPLLILAERGLADRGVTWTGGGHPILYIPNDADETWLQSDSFNHRFGAWSQLVSQRSDVFLGYCSKARSTAQAVHLYLRERLGLRVRNWELGFSAAGIILDEIDRAANLCSAGIFLFTKDDVYEGTETLAAPRDNVIFEAGFFAAAKGRDRVLIIRERDAKMPADLGGSIYLTLNDRNDISPIESSIRDFIEHRL